MAGDWIKMRTNLWDDPRVSSLCDATGSSEAAVVGALYWLWAAADEHTEDGIMPGLSVSGIDRKTGVKGIGCALVAIGWIAERPEGVRIIRFEEHNGASAKRRCSESRRKMSARDADTEQTGCRTIEEESQQSRAPREDVDVEKSKPLKSKSRAEAATASRLPAEWVPSDVDQHFCATERPDLDCQAVADRFRDYWIAVPSAKGRKRDWPATWRNWVRNENKSNGAAHGKNGSSRADRISSTIAELTGANRDPSRVVEGVAERVG